jgi:tetratricopeptide (TPR) repeat protein
LNLSNIAKISFAFLVGLLADSFFSFPKEKISHILLASILLLILISELNPKVYKISNLSQKIIRFSFFGILFFSLIISVFRFKGEYYSVKLFQAKHENNYRKLIDFGQKGNSLFYKTNLTTIPLKSYMGYGYNKLGKYDSLFLVSREAYLISPYSFEVLNNYGFILEKFHQNREAKKIMLKAYRINPINEMTLYNLVVLEFNTKNYRKAKFWLIKIPNYKNKYSKTYSKILENIK